MPFYFECYNLSSLTILQRSIRKLDYTTAAFHLPQNVGNLDLALETVNKSSLDKSLIENILV